MPTDGKASKPTPKPSDSSTGAAKGSQGEKRKTLHGKPLSVDPDQVTRQLMEAMGEDPDRAQVTPDQDQDGQDPDKQAQGQP